MNLRYVNCHHKVEGRMIGPLQIAPGTSMNTSDPNKSHPYTKVKYQTVRTDEPRHEPHTLHKLNAPQNHIKLHPTASYSTKMNQSINSIPIA